MHVVTDLADEGAGHAQALECDQDVGWGAPGVALEELLPCGRGPGVGEVDEQLSKGGDCKHVGSFRLGPRRSRGGRPLVRPSPAGMSVWSGDGLLPT